jgi:YtcA family
MSVLRANGKSAIQRRRLAMVLLALGITCCPAWAGSSPTIDVLGSYFPAWLICIVIGLGLTIIARLLLIALKLNTHLHPAPIVYSCLLVIFTMTTWLVLYKTDFL